MVIFVIVLVPLLLLLLLLLLLPQGIANIKRVLWRYSIPSQLAYIGEMINTNTFDPKMDHLVCYLPGTLALGYMNGLEE